MCADTGSEQVNNVNPWPGDRSRFCTYTSPSFVGWLSRQPLVAENRT